MGGTVVSNGGMVIPTQFLRRSREEWTYDFLKIHALSESDLRLFLHGGVYGLLWPEVDYVGSSENVVLR